MIHKARRGLIVGIFAAFGFGSASAAPTTAFEQSSAPGFMAAAPPLTVRDMFEMGLTNIRRADFEDLSIGTKPDSLAFTGGTTTSASLTLGIGCTEPNNRCAVGGGTSQGRFNTTGTAVAPAAGKWWESDGSFTLGFVDAVKAFGFYGTDLGDLGGELKIELFRGATTASADFSYSPAHDTKKDAEDFGAGTNGSLVFWGFKDDADGFKNIRISVFQNASRRSAFDVFGFDDLLIGDVASTQPPTTPVPEPASLALVALSLGGLAFTRRRKTRPDA